MPVTAAFDTLISKAKIGIMSGKLKCGISEALVPALAAIADIKVKHIEKATDPSNKADKNQSQSRTGLPNTKQ